MNILALEPYYGGSHKAFIDDLSRSSEHAWTVLTLPAHKWKWRMRHSAVTFAMQAQDLVKNGRRWDLLFCSDMLNLAEFTALAPAEIAGLPKIIYFHENQLTYPVRFESERDYQFAMTNFTSALAAEAVWFNSKFHMESFFKALAKFLKSMPDHQPTEAIELIKTKSSVHPPGINDIPSRSKRSPGPIRILWAARWEHDKNPEDFFEAIKIIKENNVQFKLSVIGQGFRERPKVFEQAHRCFRDHIDHWGYQQSRGDYENILTNADVIVSTANHEFFGISVVEAISAVAYPVLPKCLSYPEIIGPAPVEDAEQFFYDGTAKGLAKTLTELAERVQFGQLWPNEITPATLTDRFKWRDLAGVYDQAIEKLRKQ